MSNQKSVKPKILNDSCWNYFLKLESDFYSTARYLGASKVNDPTCSIEFAQQLVCINTETEAILKKICKRIDSKNPAANMGHYKRALLQKFPEIYNESIRIDSFDRTVHPFAGWNKTNARLDWWNAFQDVKHQRETNIEKANLINTLNALCALMILELHLYELFARDEKKPHAKTRLLNQRNHNQN